MNERCLYQNYNQSVDFVSNFVLIGVESVVARIGNQFVVSAERTQHIRYLEDEKLD